MAELTPRRLRELRAVWFERNRSRTSPWRGERLGRASGQLAAARASAGAAIRTMHPATTSILISDLRSPSPLRSPSLFGASPQHRPPLRVSRKGTGRAIQHGGTG